MNCICSSPCGDDYRRTASLKDLLDSQDELLSCRSIAGAEQSGLSASIKELEQEFGCRLVERATRKVSFTESGRLFLQHARTTLAALHHVIQEVQFQDGLVRGRLQLGILQSLGPYVDLPLLLRRFREAYPAVEVSVRALRTDTIPAFIRSGEVDVSFHAIVGRTEWPGVQVIPYAQDSLEAVCSRGHSLEAAKSVTLSRLAEETFVDLTPDRALRRLVDQTFGQAHLTRHTAFEVSDISTALQFVQHGLGVAVMPSALARSFAPTGKIVTIKLRAESPAIPKWRIAIVRRPRQKTQLGKSTADLLLEILSDM